MHAHNGTADTIMVKASIIYFSQTGNTEMVAYSISGRLMSEGVENKTFQLSEAADSHEAYVDTDMLGLGFPTFFGYPPPNVMKFIDGLKPVAGRTAFVFTTYGGAMAGDSLYDAAKALAGKGYRILGGLKVEASDNYPQRSQYKVVEGRPNDADLAKAEEFAVKVVRAHKAGATLDPEALASSNPFFINNRDRPRSDTVNKMREKIEGKIIFKEDKCLFCDTCKKSCPSKSIETGETFPVFTWKCLDGMLCYQCVRICPGKALQVEHPISDEEYQQFWKSVGDTDEEKASVYLAA
jgi:flavodoxin/ferredoxin